MTRFLSKIHTALLFSVALAISMTASAADEILVEINAENFERENCVISFPIPDEFKNESSLQLVGLNNQQEIPVQIDRSVEVPQLVWILEDRLPAGEIRRYRLQKGSDSTTAADRIRVTDDKQQVDVTADGKPVFSYRSAIVKAPNREQAYYDKSAYIHPLYTPSGKLLTDDFNPDHAHQHGVMFTWRKIIFDGRESNGWDQKSQLGEVSHRDVSDLISGPVFGGFTAHINHIDLTDPKGPATLLEETWKIRVYALKDRYLIDLVSSQECATDQPVKIAKIHYGGMTIRGRADWAEHRDYDYATSEGKNKVDGNQSRPEWVEMFGPVGEESAGVTLFCDPNNFRFPQPVRLHPTMPYFCFAVAALGDFEIEPAAPYVSRYLLSVHDGESGPLVNQQLWNDLAHPPAVKIIRSNQ